MDTVFLCWVLYTFPDLCKGAMRSLWNSYLCDSTGFEFAKFVKTGFSTWTSTVELSCVINECHLYNIDCSCTERFEIINSARRFKMLFVIVFKACEWCKLDGDSIASRFITWEEQSFRTHWWRYRVTWYAQSILYSNFAISFPGLVRSCVKGLPFSLRINKAQKQMVIVM